MKQFMNETEKRRILSEVALGNIPADTILFYCTSYVWVKDRDILSLEV